MIILCTIRKIRPQQYIEVKNIYREIQLVRSYSTLDLTYKVHGPSPIGTEAIVVLHGFLGSKRNWQSICDRITADTKKPVVAVDARNHGDSPHNDVHDYITLAADVSELILKLSLKKSIIIGHSMGGRTGMVLALTQPSKVARLVVVDISPIIPTTGGRPLDFFPKVIAVMTSVDFTGMDTLNKARAAAKKKLLESQLFPDEGSMYFILMNVGQLPDKSFGWKCNVKSLQKNFDNIVSFPYMAGKKYKGPTLFVGGRLSNFIPSEHMTGIRKLFPKATLVYIKGAGHNPHAEKPNEFLNAVKEFIS